MDKDRWVRNIGLTATGFFLLAVAIASYWPVLNNTLISDDWVFVFKFRNNFVSDLWNLFTSQPSYVRPMTMFVFWIQSSLFGYNPWVSHLFNVILHAGIAFVFFWILVLVGAKKLTAFIIALLFVLTPVAPDAVTWSSGRTDELALFFILMAVGLYWVFLTKRRLIFFICAMIASTAALLSKELSYILIVLLPVIDFIYGGILFPRGIETIKDGSTQQTDIQNTKYTSLSRRVWLQLCDRGFLFRQAVLFSLICGNVILHYVFIGKMGGYDEISTISVPNIGGIRSTFRTMLAPLNEAEFSWGIIRALRNYTVILCLAGAALVVFRWRKTSAKVRRLFLMVVIFFVVFLLPVFTPLFTYGIYQDLKNSRWLYSPTLALLAMIVIALLEFGWQRRAWKILASTLLILLVPVYAVGLNLNNRLWERAGVQHYSIQKQVVELASDPPPGARLAFKNLPAYKDGVIMGYGFQQTIQAAYGRDDLVVIWLKKSDPEPGLDTEEYLFEYDKESGQLRLIKTPEKKNF